MMLTIALIDPSPTDRAPLAAALRRDFCVLESATLTPATLSPDTRLLIVAAPAVTPEVLKTPPFATLPCLVLGSFAGAHALARPGALRVVARPVDPSIVLPAVRMLLATGHEPEPEREIPPLARPPFIPDSVVEALEQVARTHHAHIPVLITGERGTGKRTVARHLHQLAGNSLLVRVTPLTASRLTDRRAELLHGSPAPVTLVADAIDAFAGEAQALLVECLESGSLAPIGAPRPFWLIATTAGDLRALADAGRFDAALAARLAASVIELPPLRTRSEDVLPIAREVLQAVGSTIEADLWLDTDVAAHFLRYPWPGNLNELLSVVRRSAVLTPVNVIGPNEVAFAFPGLGTSPQREDVAPPHTAEVRDPAPPPDAALPPAPPRLELILTELAHELKNPMVTIKTFAQHLPTVLEDAELRERFATLTDDAVSRMDRLLDNVLDFARLGAPHPESVPLTPLLDQALADTDEALERRDASVRRVDWDRSAMVLADQGHLEYALRNLFDSLASELPHHEELAVQLTDNGSFAVRFVGEAGVTAKLQRFLANGTEAGHAPMPTELPLRFVLARAVITRNGGEVAVDAAGSNETLVTVALPSARTSPVGR